MVKLTALFLLTLLPLNLYADTIILKSGQKVEGKILSQDDEAVMIDFCGVELKYYRSDISDIQAAPESNKKQDNTATAVTDADKPGEEKAITDPFEKGEKYLSENRMWEAISAFKDSFSQDPKDPKSAYNVAGAYFLMGKFDDAAEWYKKAISADSKHTNSYIGLGITSRLLNKYPEAVTAFRQALDLDSKNVIAMSELAMCYQLQQDWANTIEWYKKALAIDGGNAQAWHFLGMAQGRVGDYIGAINSIKQAVAVNPDYADAYISLVATMVAAKRNSLLSGQDWNVEQIKDYLNLAQNFYTRAGDKNNLARVKMLFDYLQANPEVK